MTLGFFVVLLACGLGWLSVAGDLPLLVDWQVLPTFPLYPSPPPPISLFVVPCGCFILLPPFVAPAPFLCSGDPSIVGVGPGAGKNLNIGWDTDEDTHMGDAEYLAAWKHVLLPIAREVGRDCC